MEKSALEDQAGLVGVGILLGHTQAFGLTAARCTAAQASALTHLRQGKNWKFLAPTWDEFCPRYLKISRSEADKIIKLWEDFGAGYFEVAQLTRISAETYRALQPSVTDSALHWNGEVIALDVENAQKVASAVSEVRGRTRPRPKPPVHLPDMLERIEDMETRCTTLIGEIEEILYKERHGEHWIQFTRVLARLGSKLDRIRKDNGI